MLTPVSGTNKTGDVTAKIEFTPRDGTALEKTVVGLRLNSTRI